MSQKVPFKYCIVPCCTSTTVNTSEKVFFNVPKDPVKRKAWTNAMKRDDKLNPKLSSKTTHVCCEDHFSLPEDMENYWQWKLMKHVKRLQLKPAVIPHIFNCQRKRPISVERSAAKKRRNMLLVQEAMSSYYSTETPNTSSTTSGFALTSSEITQEDGNPHMQVKREFFKYFQMGLSARDAKKKFIEHYKHKKPAKKNPTPTIIQAEFLYKEWQRVKDDEYWQYSLNNTMKEGIWIKSEQGAISFKEFLDVAPKREIMYSVKHLESETDIPIKSDKNTQNQDIKFPLVFISVDSVEGMPGTTAPLLYKLKHGIGGDLVSDVVRPRIYSLCIEKENSSEPVSNEILGILTSVDESRASVEAAPKYTLDIPIKSEPLNDGYEDMPNQGSTETMEDTFILPISIQAFSSRDTTTERIDIKTNICSGDATTIKKIDIKPNICKADNSFFPLVFTLKGSVYETSKSRSLVYDLKQSSTGVQATEIVMPQISSVQINSLNEATFQPKGSSMLSAEGPLSITIQTEFLEVNSNAASSNNGVNEKVDGEAIPVIFDGSSCNDHFPVIIDYQLNKDQGKTSDTRNVNKPVRHKRMKTEIKKEV